MTGNVRFYIDMGIRISKRRKELKMTQEQLAEKVSLSLQSISCIELGKKAIRPDNLIKLSTVLNVSTDYILTGKKDVEQVTPLLNLLSTLNKEDYEIIEQLIFRLTKNNSASN